MIDAQDEELLHREIDGENSAEESARLKDLMAAHAELRAYYERLSTLAQTLANAEKVGVPPGLARKVMRSIRRRERFAALREGLLDTFRFAFTRRPVLGYAATLAAGLVLGTLLAALADKTPPFWRRDVSYLSGTMLPDNRLRRLQLVAEQSFAAEGIQGKASTKLGDNLVLAEIQLDSSRAVDVTIEFDSNALSVLAFERSGASGGGVALGPRQLRLQHIGEATYRMVLGVKKPVPSPLRLRLAAADVSLERTLETRQGGPR